MAKYTETAPKFIESAFGQLLKMASLLGWLMDGVRLAPDRSGKLVETFAFNKIMAHIDAAGGRYELFHYRDREKREIDFLIEREDNALLVIEIKAGSAVGKNDFKHLRWFQNNLAKQRPLHRRTTRLFR